MDEDGDEDEGGTHRLRPLRSTRLTKKLTNDNDNDNDNAPSPPAISKKKQTHKATHARHPPRDHSAPASMTRPTSSLSQASKRPWSSTPAASKKASYPRAASARPLASSDLPAPEERR